MNLTDTASRTSSARVKLEGATPATIAIATLFSAFCVYFIVESYFLTPEQYVGMPPYLLMALIGLLAVVTVFFTLANIEPARSDTLTYAVLVGMGCIFFLYPFMTRVNAWTDNGALEPFVYVLNSEYHWEAKDAATPDIDMYIKDSVWWQQFQPGDEYTFKLRQGGLGFWQVNMTQVYRDQVHWAQLQLIDRDVDPRTVAAAGY